MLVIFTYLAYAYIAYCVIRILLNREWATHKKALHKFVALWVISTSPIFVGYLFLKAENSKGFSSYFKIEEQFVYAAAFIAPVLYIFYEAIWVAANSEKSDKYKEFRDKVKGYDRLFFPSLLLLVTTVLAYAGSRIGETSFRETIFFSTFSGQNIYIYGSALILWYSSVLLDTPSDKSVTDVLRGDADALKKAANDRISGGEN